MTISGTGAHVLVFPYPAQGHMIPLLDLTHQLATRGLTVTILVTPKNLNLLSPLLSFNHPSIKTLVLPFPSHPSIPDGVENSKDLPANLFITMMHALGELYSPLLNWFKNHPSPPVAIISDMFLGWTNKLACELGIHRLVFSPSGAKALSVIYSLWSEMPKLQNADDPTVVFTLQKIPNAPKYPWWQISPIYRRYVEGNPVSEFIRDGFLGNIGSWGLVINTFSVLERVYLDHLAKEMGSDRVWAVGPLLPPDDDSSGPTERVCEGAQTVPNSTELAKAVAESVGDNRVMRDRAMELSKAAVDSIKGGGSVKDLNGLVKHVGVLDVMKMRSMEM
ncbi:hypothetical protein Pint_16315 [Pistacia integerrima]|uniref:Uncharacterized protein n=1 Tax=Pistacia integerrima TaxID=434235 RepID=A0ACC0ZAM5_9ROSI|nr:hypothetical protein Pint_16315 [Pistacia integerrima]